MTAWLAICAPCLSAEREPTEAFADRLQPVATNSGFRMPGFNVWCGSVIKAEDHRYYMFASRWPSDANWVLDSEVVLASADKPEGPYRFENVVLPRRDARFWDGLMTHNPTIHKYKDTYLLYYIGTTCTGRNAEEAWSHKRIGLATAPSVKGPWTRRDAPILNPRPGHWDNLTTSNPGVCVMPDGKVFLVYKSTRNTIDALRPFGFDLRLGMAVAETFKGPYKAVSEEPILTFPGLKDSNVEDPCLWHEEDGFHMLLKVFGAGENLIGESFGGLHALSQDGIHWQLAPQPKGYSRTIHWQDGRVETLQRLERVQVLLENGKPTHLVCGAIDSHGKPLGNIVIPIRPPAAPALRRP